MIKTSKQQKLYKQSCLVLIYCKENKIKLGQAIQEIELCEDFEET